MNIQKTKVMGPTEERVTIDNNDLEVVKEYTYLGHKIKIGKENQTAEISRRTSLSWAAFGKLGHIMKNTDIPISLKRKVYDTCVLPVTTYGLETMTLTKKSMLRLRTIQRAMERTMIGVSLRDKINHEQIRQRTKVTDINEKILKMKWRWAGHVARQDPNRWDTKIIGWRSRTTKRNRGRPQKRWTDDLKAIAGKNWTQIAQDRDTWRKLEEAFIQQWIDQG
jgi:hypothetical protein